MDPLQAELPDALPLVVIMERREVRGNRWTDASWRAVGVTVDGRREHEPAEPRRVHAAGGVVHELHAGFVLQLQRDECESYYHNLLSPQPSCYVVASLDKEARPLPQRVTLSFDEAHAYMEGEEELYTVAMPPEIYRWAETFVLRHYVPEKRYKRRRRAWHQEQERN